MPALPALLALSVATAVVGALGGLGGAVFLVPALVLLGVEPQLAAPLGLLSVAAGSLAAGPRQLRDGLVHHRLGVTLELVASAGAIGGALLAAEISGRSLTLLLAVTAIGAALTGLRSRGVRNPPSAGFHAELAGEWPGTLGGAYRLGDSVVPYQAGRVPLGMVAMAGAGIISGLAGVGGGFIKTPAMTEIMRIPVKVAAATTTFTVGVTAATGLLVFWAQDRIDQEAGAAVVLGGLVGGLIGAVLQERLPPTQVRRVLSIALAGVGVVLGVTAFTT
jgi:uncharacterized membrane protein YfcA